MSHTTTGQGCNLNIVSVQTSKEGEGLDEYKALYHLGWFVGLKDVQQCTVQDANFEAADKVPDAPTNCRQDDAVQGRMMNPFNLPLRDVESHYLSCSDGRSQYAVVGSPGGDAVEFIHGLNAMEKAIHMPLTPDGIDQLFKEFLEHMPSFGKQYFYMHTDAPAHEALHRAASVPDPPNPLDADARRKLVRVAGEPEHVGCSHLRALLEDESSFGVRRNLTEAVIQSFLGVYYNPFDKYRERLMYAAAQRPTPAAARGEGGGGGGLLPALPAAPRRMPRRPLCSQRASSPLAPASPQLPCAARRAEGAGCGQHCVAGGVPPADADGGAADPLGRTLAGQRPDETGRRA